MDKHQKQILWLRAFLQGQGFYRALDALEYGLSIHKGLRKNGDPEFQHQIEIVLYIISIRANLLHTEDTIVSALLHDTPEDYYIDHRYISERFGAQAGEAIYLLDKNGKSTDQYFLNISQNAIASIVKGVDRMHNVRTMRHAFKIEKQVRYTAEVREHFLPMLKVARRKFPRQVDAYENIKLVLNILIEGYEHTNANFGSTGINQPTSTTNAAEPPRSVSELASQVL